MRRFSVLMLVVAAAMAASVAAAATVNPDLAGLQRLQGELADPTLPQPQRDEAARRLMARPGQDGPDAVLAALEDFANRGGQLSAARALADAPNPDHRFIDPLFALLANDRPLADAAANALAKFRNDSEVLPRLETIATAHQQPDPSRLAAIAALGQLPEREAAETLLLDLLLPDDQSIAIRNAAADALVEMTGLTENDRDVQRWQRWWDSNGKKNDADFKADLLASRAARFDQLQLRHHQLMDELQTVLAEQYEAASESQKSEMLMRYLQSSQPELRVVGARIIYDDAIDNRTIPAAARQALRGMVGDSDADVRRAAAQSLRAINDAGALDALLTQLAQEPDPDVRAAIAEALAPIRAPQAVPALMNLLHDRSFRAAAAAADAIKELGPTLRQTDPDLCARLTTELQATMDSAGGEPGSQELRESCLEAMVPLRQPQLLPFWLRLLNNRESVRTRRAALAALGELQDPRAADSIVAMLDDPDATVRLEGVIALGKTSTFENAEKLAPRLDPDTEPDPSVRQEAWNVFQHMLPTATQEQLAQWADRFKNQPQRRQTVLLTLADKLQTANNPEQLAIVRQDIGETLMQLDQPAEAAGYFRQAVDYWQPHGGMVSEGLDGQLIDALLKSRQYPQAAVFASQLIGASAAHQQTVGPRFRTEAERLRSTGDLQNALLLIGEADKIKPPLAALYLQQLKMLEEDIRRQIAPAPKPPAGLPAVPPAPATPALR